MQLRNQIFSKFLLVKEGQNNLKYWWSRNHAVCKKLWLGEPLEPSRTIDESTGGHKTTQCEKTIDAAYSQSFFSLPSEFDYRYQNTAGHETRQCKKPSMQITARGGHATTQSTNKSDLYVFSTSK